MADGGKIPMAWALAISAALHAALVAAPPWRKDSKDGRTAGHPLAATLRPPPRAPAPAPEQAPLFLPPPPRAPKAAPPVPAPVATARTVPRPAADAALRQALAQVAERLLYPPEAIARGLEGEVLVLVFLDESGTAVAARVERGSGHAILDEAAVAAARTLRSLPADAPRETLLPVRFRLN